MSSNKVSKAVAVFNESYHAIMNCHLERSSHLTLAERPRASLHLQHSESKIYGIVSAAKEA